MELKWFYYTNGKLRKVLDDGGRCGCMAGDALMGVEVAVRGLRVGDKMLAAVLCCIVCC